MPAVSDWRGVLAILAANRAPNSDAAMVRLGDQLWASGHVSAACTLLAICGRCLSTSALGRLGPIRSNNRLCSMNKCQKRHEAACVVVSQCCGCPCEFTVLMETLSADR